MTPWYPPEVKPVRVGVYQRKSFIAGIGFSHWNGKKWSYTYTKKDDVLPNKRTVTYYPYWPWRGLAEPPK